MLVKKAFALFSHFVAITQLTFSLIVRTSLVAIKGGESSSQFRWFTIAKIKL